MSTFETARRLYCFARAASLAWFGGEDGLEEYRQCVIPNGTKRASVACAMRPKPKKPIFLVGDAAVVLSCGPQKPKGAHEKLDH